MTSSAKLSFPATIDSTAIQALSGGLQPPTFAPLLVVLPEPSDELPPSITDDRQTSRTPERPGVDRRSTSMAKRRRAFFRRRRKVLLASRKPD